MWLHRSGASGVPCHVTLECLELSTGCFGPAYSVLATVLKEIQVGRFDPTASRGQAFPSATYTPPVVEKLQKVLNKTVNEMAEIFMGFDPSSDMDMFGNFEMRSMWELICKEPVIVGTSNEPMLFGAIGTELREVQDSSDEDSDYSDSDSFFGWECHGRGIGQHETRHVGEKHVRQSLAARHDQTCAH